MESGEIDVAPIQTKDGAGFGDEQIERMPVVQLAVGDVDETRNVAPRSSKVCRLTVGKLAGLRMNV